jgi:PAS domain S-box-containing protein
MKAQDHYAALIESSDDGIVTKDLAGIVISWNPAAERLFGWTSEEMVGQSIRRLLPPDRQEEEDHILARIRQGEKVGQFLTQRLHKDGHRLHVEVSISPVRNARGTIVGASKIVRDASERVAAEHKLRESEERFRMLAESISQFAWIADPNGRIFWFNQRWQDYTGLSNLELPDHSGHGVVHPDHVDRVFALYTQAIERGEDYEDTFPLRSKEGDYRWFLSRAKPIRDESGAITRWFGTNTDITEQREQAEQIQLLLREVNHRSKNMLAKVQALARSSIAGDPDLVKRFEDRVGSLAVNQDILVRREWREVPVEELVRLQLGFVDNAAQRVSTTGVKCDLNPRAAEIIGMALHELATNSIKYGALSAAEGTVAVRWDCDDTNFHLEWRESGGPEVRKPRQRGFGTTLIERIPATSLNAQVRHEFAKEGVVWDFRSGPNVLAHADRMVA